LKRSWGANDKLTEGKSSPGGTGVLIGEKTGVSLVCLIKLLKNGGNVLRKKSEGIWVPDCKGGVLEEPGRSWG